MLSRKNLPGIERAIRIAIGLCLICFGVLLAAEDWAEWLAIGAGLVAICTGFLGFCPMCWLIGVVQAMGRKRTP